MDKLRIYICCHKPYEGYRDNVYTPIHLGRAVSSCTDQMQDMIGDDTGDNISKKNPYYSEATGIYWIWKNVHDCEYVGIHHYRRFFVDRFTNSNIDSYFNDGTDVLMCRPALCNYTNKWYFSLLVLSCEDLLILRSVIKGLYPEYIPTFDQAMNKYEYSFCNMILCKKDLFDEYAEWLFRILFNVEKIIKPSPYPNAQRALAYMSELLTPIFFYYHKCKISYQYYSFDGNVVLTSKKSKVAQYLLNKLLYPCCRKKTPWIDPSIVNGLLRAGINIEELEKGIFKDCSD